MSASPVSRRGERRVVFGLGGLLLMVGLVGAFGAAGWVVQMERLRQDFDVELQPWQTAEIPLPVAGDLLFMRRRADPDGDVWERRIRYRLPSAPGLELPLPDAPIDQVTGVSLWPTDDDLQVVFADPNATTVMHLGRGVSRRVHPHDRGAWVVDVEGVGNDGSGRVLEIEGHTVFVPTVPASVEHVEPWPPETWVTHGELEQTYWGVSLVSPARAR